MTDFPDHYSQFASVKKPKTDFKSINLFARDYSKFSEESFCDDVSIQNFDNDYTDVNEQFNDFYFRLKGVVDRHAPIKKLKPKEVKIQHKPWITSELRKLIKKKNRLFNRKKRQPCNEDIKARYNELRNKVNRELNKAKKAYYASYFKENSKNSKKVWEGIKSIINTKNPNITIVNHLKINKETIDDPKQISESFNKYFTSIGPNTEKSIPINPIANPDKYLRNRNEYEFIIAHTSNEEILEIISELENKSTGPQSIPVKLLKTIPDLILVPLSKIISTSFSTGTFPDALKISKVIPIHKGGSSEDLNNYRPISLLSIFDKVIEKMMHKRLYAFLEQHDILYPKQFGFRKNNSITMSLLDITERIKETIDRKRFVCSVFIDLRKAFDTVNHSILLHKLENYGIRGTSLNWFKSYLSNRKQYVYINGETSSLLDITCGVPQGSVLGPLLFLIYINDLPNISKIFEIFLFADDTNLYHEANSLESPELEINKDLRHLHSWLIVNRLSLNIDKTNFVVFYPYNKHIGKKITLKIQKKAIPENKAVKYLGLMIDSGLTWKTHIDKLAKKVSCAIGLMRKIRPYVTIEILKTLYYSLIYSHLSYAIEVWGSADQTHLNTLLILQKRSVRMIFMKDRRLVDYTLQASEPLFHQIKFLKIHDIFKHRLLMFIFKCLNQMNPHIFNSWFNLTSQVHGYQTRSKFAHFEDYTITRTLFIHSARTSHYGLKLTRVLGAKIWNSLPPGKNC